MSNIIKLMALLMISSLGGFLNSLWSEVPFLTPAPIPKVDLFEEAKAKIPQGLKAITVKEAHQIFTKNSSIFLDARLAKDFAEEHIEDAANLPISNIDENIYDFMDQYAFDTPFVIYCGSIHCDSSTRLAVKLQEVGYKDIKIFLEGWAEWRAQILKK